MSPNQSDSEYDAESRDVVVELLQEFHFMCYGLALIVLIMSLAMTLFIRNQNRRLQKQLDATKKQIEQIEQGTQLQQNREGIENLLKELALQVNSHPEVQQILGRYGYQIQNQPAEKPR